MSEVAFTPLGGGHEIGANSYLLRAGDHDILLDCGVHPKKDGMEALPALERLDRPPEAVIVSHGHVDHCGALPRLLRDFKSTSSYATTATVSIMDRMLHNSVAVMGAIAEERGVEGYPLYSHDDVDNAIRRTWGVRFNNRFLLHPHSDISASLHPAGHVLGGASVLLRMDDHSLFYTGDICATDQELLAGRVPLDDAIAVDTLVIESTYGANDEADQTCFEDEVSRFAETIRGILEGGGVALVPTFALGRTQEMLNVIARLQENGEVPEVPVMASGLGRAIYEVYNMYPEYLRAGSVLRPLSQFGRIGDAWKPRNVKDLLSEPAIIVATSGMMIENTPSALIAQEMVRHKHHGILFVGYLDPDTLGYKLLHSTPGTPLQFQLGASPVEVQLENITWYHFSAHAPREALCDVVRCMRPRNVVFVHGDSDAVEWMHSHAVLNGCRPFAPGIGETVILKS